LSRQISRVPELSSLHHKTAKAGANDHPCQRSFP
jgi:hypothetical protein